MFLVYYLVFLSCKGNLIEMISPVASCLRFLALLGISWQTNPSGIAQESTPIHYGGVTDIKCPSFHGSITKTSNIHRDVEISLTQSDNLSNNEATSNSNPAATTSNNANHSPSTTSSNSDEEITMKYDELFDQIIEPGNTFGVLVKILPKLKDLKDRKKFQFPASLLEPRSMLEVVTDHFSHPDQFVKIADSDNPRDRMVQVVRWYLSSFHAALRSSVAQLPISAVLGETFRCYWDVPGYNASSQPPVTDGPVPWAKRNELTYIAENVQQNPYINAIYVEHYNKRITFSSYMEVKLRFSLPASLTMINVGKAFVHLIDHNEIYSLTFPTLLIGSLFTTPTVEIADKVTINCEKTGHQATIIFEPKPMFGGDYNKINANIIGPGNDKPFVTISGKWNSVMQAKWSNGKTEKFVDVDELPLVKKTVLPINEQEDNESRKIWKDVMAAVRSNDDNGAKRAKDIVFQKEDEKENQRKRDGVTWKSTLFHSDSEKGWVYNSPLIKRISPARK